MQNAWHAILQLRGFLLTRQDLAKFNAFFIDAEEDAIIQLSFLQEQLVAAKSLRETAAAKAAFVHFHGALVQSQKLPHGPQSLTPSLRAAEQPHTNWVWPPVTVHWWTDP